MKVDGATPLSKDALVYWAMINQYILVAPSSFPGDITKDLALQEHVEEALQQLFSEANKKTSTN